MTRKIALMRDGESSWNLECRPPGWIEFAPTLVGGEDTIVAVNQCRAEK
ncbi:hypothetical protein [Niveibacterium terrae]